MPSIHLERVSFAFGDAAPILDQAALHLPEGWSGLVGENGAGKTTLLRLLAGEIEPDSGVIRFQPDAPTIALCPQEVEEPGRDIPALARRDDGEACRIRGALGLRPAELERWETLSPGERKRWQVGAALARAPEILLLDEPTNHADAEMRALLLAALQSFRGAGLVVSHDRALLDCLTERTLRLSGGQARLYPGSYREASALWEAEAREAQTRRSAAQEEARRAERKLADARRERDAAQRSMSGRGRDPKDRDGRSVVAKTRRAWAEDGLGARVNRTRAAAERARQAIPDLAARVELGRSVFVGFAPAPKPTLLSLDLEELRAGEVPLLREVRVRLGREDRVRLEGPNGAGKTTLLEALLAGSTLDERHLLFLPQETEREEAAELLAQVRGLEHEVRGRVLSLVAALGTDPDRLLASQSPSPGEVRKLQLAFGLGRHVWALVLDEPTNHLDLPTVERLEEALAQYPGAILLVSHDDAFAGRVASRSWRIANGTVEMR